MNTLSSPSRWDCKWHIMAAQCRFYFLAPTWHNHPASGTLQLGNIMTGLRAPGAERPLYRGPPPPPPKLVDTPPDVGSMQRTESYQTNYEFSIDKLRAGKFGIWTKFLSVLGLGADLGYEWKDRLVLWSSCVGYRQLHRHLCRHHGLCFSVMGRFSI